MKLFKSNKKYGFTMTELMAVVAIVGILVVAAVPLLNNANQNIMMSKTRLSLQQDARNIMSLITRLLRKAKTSTVSISRHDSSQPFYSKITFSTIDNKNYQFYQSGKNLYMADGTNTKILTSDLRYLAFAFPESSDMSIVSLSLTLEKELFSGRRKALHMASEKVMLMND